MHMRDAIQHAGIFKQWQQTWPERESIVAYKDKALIYQMHRSLYIEDFQGE